MPFGIIPAKLARNAMSKQERSGLKVQKTVVRRIATRVVQRRLERKHHNFTSAGYINIPAVSTANSDCNLIPQGLLDINRVGDRCDTVNFIARFTLQKIAAGADVTCNVRVIFFLWRPNSVPTAADILNIGPSTVIDPLSEYNHDTRQEYKILYDKNITLTPATELLRRTFVVKRKLKKILQFVNASTVGTNHLYMNVTTDANGATLPAMSYHIRTYFRD